MNFSKLSSLIALGAITSIAAFGCSTEETNNKGTGGEGGSLITTTSSTGGSGQGGDSSSTGEGGNGGATSSTGEGGAGGTGGASSSSTGGSTTECTEITVPSSSPILSLASSGLDGYVIELDGPLAGYGLIYEYLDIPELSTDIDLSVPYAEADHAFSIWPMAEGLEKEFSQKSGTLNLSAFDYDTCDIKGVVKDLVLAEAVYDSGDYTFTDGGDCYVLKTAEFSREVPAAWTGDPLGYQDGACDCGGGTQDSDCSSTTDLAECGYCADCGVDFEDECTAEAVVSTDTTQCVDPGDGGDDSGAP